MPPPGLPAPWRNRWKAPFRWLYQAQRRRLRLPLGGLLLCGGVWLLTLVPARQPLEGTLEATSISFSFPAAVQKDGVPLLGQALRSLSLVSLSGGEPLQVTISGRTLELADGDSLTLEAPQQKGGPGPVLYLGLRVPGGAQVRHLQASGSGERELQLDVLPPAVDASGASVSLEITPDPGRPLQARLSAPDGPAPAVPTAQFSALVRGPVQLRLTPSDPGKAIVFEPALPMRNLSLDVEQRSLFDGSPLLRSSLRGGELHLGQREPLKLRPDQFLTIQPPGVNELADLQLAPKGNSFSLAVVGESTALSAGLSRRHPSTVVQGTVLSHYLSPEQITGFYGVLAGMASTLLLVLFNVD